MGAKAEGGLRWTVVSIRAATGAVAEGQELRQRPQGRRQEHAVKAVEVVAPMPEPKPERKPEPKRGARPHRHAAGTGRAGCRDDHARSSLIVSDNRLSDETGEYTDFIVLTR